MLLSDGSISDTVHNANFDLAETKATKAIQKHSMNIGGKERNYQTDPAYIVNAIGIIPQKKPTDEQYDFVNTQLPLFLDTLGIRILHPSTDCEFSGNLPVGECYTTQSLRDAEDVYGKSKAIPSEKLEKEGKYTKIIRTSIIGHEDHTAVALLDWFLNATGEAKGYTNHYWNGITTLEWAKQAKRIIEQWDLMPVLNQYATESASKYDLLCTIRDVYQKDIQIVPFETPQTVNKCLTSDIELPSIRNQLYELKQMVK